MHKPKKSDADGPRPSVRYASRRTVVRASLLLGMVSCLAGCGDWLGGHFVGAPEDAAFLLSTSAQELVDAAYSDVEPGELLDFHTHALTHGGDIQNGWLSPQMLDWRRPLERLRTAVYFSAAGISDRQRAQAQYLSRLMRLIRSQPKPGRHVLLAFDQVHDEAGNPQPQLSPFYVSNDYVLALARRYPDVFIAGMSVHPYRRDVLSEITRLADAGARVMKWLPNVQNFDPAAPQLSPIYELMAARDIVLLSHGGKELAMDGVANQEWGNPLRLRPALAAGVKVIVAHAAGLGESADLDQEIRPPVANFQLLMRMLREQRYADHLFVDISATTQFNRVPDTLNGLLQRPDLFHRVVNGSDYPLPAVNMAVHLNRLVAADLIAESDAQPLREIYGFNPLMFDYVLKRRLQLPGTRLRFPSAVFTGHGLLPP